MNPRMSLISFLDFAPWSSSIMETIEAARSGSESMRASAFESPRKHQSNTSVSKIKDAPLSYVPGPRCRVSHILAILPHSKRRVVADPGTVSFAGNRHNFGLWFAPVKNRDRLAVLDGL